jgi:NAD(P)-dependent dehydrogenase (short-subunit alcohol dehydrogenase family)
MLTGHVSRFLSGPPGPELQKLNALLHQEPYSSIAYCVYWSVVLLVGAPLAGISLMWMFCYEMSRQYVWKRRRIEPKKKNNNNTVASSLLAVVVTGCDSGFGKELVFRLAAEGFVVFAGCLEEESTKAFASAGEPLIQPLLLDVTSDNDVQEASQTVQKWLSGGGTDPNNKNNVKRYLHAVVNNAGVAKCGYIDWTKLSDYEFCMEGEVYKRHLVDFWHFGCCRRRRFSLFFLPFVCLFDCLCRSLAPIYYTVNCYAQIRMVKAFLPLFKKQATAYGDSQIMNMVSMAGMLSGTGLGLAPYEVSKHAAEAFTDALRLEMKMFGVSVVSVNPSFHTTPLTTNIQAKLKKGLWDPMPPALQNEYGPGTYHTIAYHAIPVQ